MPKITSLILAGRLRALQNLGDIPFMEWNALGGNKDLRGYTSRRYADDASLLMNVELRWRFLEWSWGKEHFDLGIHPFIDVGRVGSTWWGPGDFHPCTGAELLWTVNLVTHVNATLGFSDEGPTFVIGTRRLF